MTDLRGKQAMADGHPPAQRRGSGAPTLRPDEVAVELRLSLPQAAALAQLVKRFRFDHAESLSNRFDAGRERDHMLGAVARLQAALADAGFKPR